MKKTFLGCSQAHLGALCVMLMQALGSVAWAATTDIANTPVLGGIGVTTKPNIMLVMDTSNSMSWTHMPDSVEVSGDKQSIGYKSYQCNSLYYNPSQIYKLPKDASNARLPTPSFTAAPYNYYVDSTTVVDLSTSFRAHDASTVLSVALSFADIAQPGYYYIYTGSAVLTPTTAPCNQADTGAVNTAASILATGGGTWARKLVTSTSGVAGRPDERANFAIWYTFYRTRIGLAKSAIGLAFAPLSNNYRVGFMNGNPTILGMTSSVAAGTTVQPLRYQKIADFDMTQKIDWFSKLYGQVPAGSSPTREALARVGRHYAGKIDGINQGMPEDPVQASCQPNFTILTTDGYWNTEAEKTGLGGGPTNVAGNAWVGQQDSPRTTDTGLVPFGVFDLSNSALAYTETSSTTSRYAYDTCTRPVAAQFTRRVQKSQKYFKKVVTTAATNTTNITQTRTSTITKRTFTVTKTTTQFKTVANPMTKTTSQSLWYNASTEQLVPVASCSGLTGCTTTSTGPTADPSCVALTASLANNYLTIACTFPVTSTPVASCPVGPNCTRTVAGPTPVAANACSNATANSSNQFTTTTCDFPADNSNAVANCSQSFAVGGNTTCSTVTSPWGTVDSCTPSSATAPGFVATQCQTLASCTGSCAATVVTTFGGACKVVPGTTCTLVDTTTNTATVTNTFGDPATCTNSPNQGVPVTGENFIITTCTTVDTPSAVVGSCTPIAATSGNSWTATLCTGSVNVAGSRQKKTDTTNKTRTYSSGLVVGPTADPDVITYPSPGTCFDTTIAPALPADVTVTNAPFVVAASATGGSSNSLADVAQYYYKTDLRPTMADIVRPGGTAWYDDKATWQHMTTFVVGLGVSGTKTYREDYLTATTGDFANIRTGADSWPIWPDTTLNYAANAQLYSDPKSIDDFWHAAVNGRGRYFSANNPDSVVAGISGSLSAIDATVGAGSSVGLSDLAGFTIDGLNYTTSYTSGIWVGDVQARLSDSSSTLFWSARAKLDTQTQAACDDRNIYIRKVGSTNNLGKFTFNTTKCSDGSTSSELDSAVRDQLSATSLNQYPDFTNGTLGTANQLAQASVSSLVNYLRGQRQNEGFVSGSSGKLYRLRSSVMGDIINSKPQYVGVPVQNYSDAGYSSFKSAQATRQGMLYVGGNDGMLHALYAPPVTATGADLTNAGKEAWAYVPTLALSSLSALGGNNYGTNHRFFVDGTPVIGDVVKDNSWKTILVGGLNGGGKGFYALDITNPTTPISLWEFDSTSCGECDVGLSFGKPVIGKLKDGTWAVFLTSGYNNSTGKGILFVLDAVTGTLIRAINTGTGVASDPAGLAQVSAWTERAGIDDTVERVYGGDLLGNIWRFDVNGVIAPAGYDAKLIATAKDASGLVQPITTAPELGIVNKRAFVYVGTGRILGLSDLNNTQTQTVYGVWDDLKSGSSIISLRDVLTKNTTNASTYSVDCTGTAAVCNVANPNGWYVDLAVSKEQINLPLALVGSTLAIVTNQPQADACATGGTSRVYFVDTTAGKTAGPGLLLGSNGVAGLTLVNQEGTSPTANSVGTSASVKGYARDVTGAQISPFTIPINPPPSGANRTNWRELVQP